MRHSKFCLDPGRPMLYSNKPAKMTSRIKPTGQFCTGVLFSFDFPQIFSNFWKGQISPILCILVVRVKKKITTCPKILLLIQVGLFFYFQAKPHKRFPVCGAISRKCVDFTFSHTF